MFKLLMLKDGSVNAEDINRLLISYPDDEEFFLRDIPPYFSRTITRQILSSVNNMALE